MINRFSSFSLVASVSILAVLFVRGVVYQSDHFDFPPEPHEEILKSSNLLFHEASQEMGVDVQFRSHWPNPNVRPILRKLRRIPPSLAIADFDKNDLPDIAIATGEFEHGGLRIFKNLNGKKFQEVTSEWLKGISTNQISTVLAVADFNSDGHQDIVVGRYGRHSLYFWNPIAKVFEDKSEHLNQYYSNPESVAVLDYDQDGHLDLFWGNYYPEWDLSTMAPPRLPFVARGDLKTGGVNHLMRNQDGHFQVTSAFPFSHAAHTVTTGVSDVNNDGLPDILEGNEYAPDFLFINRNGKNFVDETESLLPLSEHGFSSMNSEFFDFDFDGISELYITNISAYPIMGRGNILWKRDGSAYRNIASSMGVSSCGFSWTGKFADFDLNGKNELYVINGGYSGASEKSPNYWYFQSLRDSIPMWMRGVPSGIDIHDFNRSGHQKDCLFEEHDGQFRNVAAKAKVADPGDGRGMAVVDFNNDGLMDIAVANQTGPLRIYMNHSKKVKNWLGLKLIDKKESLIPHGAEVRATFKDGRKLYREIYPLNGHNGQSDPRVVVAVDDHTDLTKVDVRWPDGQTETYSQLNINQYNVLRQTK